MKFRQCLALAAAGLLCASGALAASPRSKVMYVQVPKAEIRDGKTQASALVAQVDQGTRVTVLGEEGVRYLVQLDDGRKGYVSRMSVSDAKPSSGGLGLALNDDRDINERRTAASGRGLSEAAKQMGKDGTVNTNAVKWVEKMESLAATISASDIKNFRKEGGLP